MSGSRFGRNFSVTTFGESHGPAIGGIVEGCPSGLPLSVNDIQLELNHRKPGQSKQTSQRREPDQIEILSGVYEGKTTGTPIGLLIKNTDVRSNDYEDFKNCFRPGHGDYTYFKKYGVWDHRGGGRASARETAIRVAAGAIAKKVLAEHDVTIRACVIQIGEIRLTTQNWSAVYENPFYCADPEAISQLEAYFDHIRSQRESIGAKITCELHNVPTGLGEPVFDKCEAMLAHAMLSIPAVRGFEIGDGFQVVEQLGSQHRDPITPEGFSSNHAGGVLAGISTGQTINFNVALKPTSSIPQLINTVTVDNEACDIMVKGRHDPCVGLRAVPVVEAMSALALVDLLLCDHCT